MVTSVTTLLARIKGWFIYPPEPGGPIAVYSVWYRWGRVTYPDWLSRVRVVCWWHGW